jgi:hypothetical protein
MNKLDKSVDMKDSFYKELEHVFSHFVKHHMKFLLGDFRARKIFSYQQLEMIIYMELVMVMGLE